MSANTPNHTDEIKVGDLVRLARYSIASCHPEKARGRLKIGDSVRVTKIITPSAGYGHARLYYSVPWIIYEEDYLWLEDAEKVEEEPQGEIQEKADIPMNTQPTSKSDDIKVGDLVRLAHRSTPCFRPDKKWMYLSIGDTVRVTEIINQTDEECKFARLCYNVPYLGTGRDFFWVKDAEKVDENTKEEIITVDSPAKSQVVSKDRAIKPGDLVRVVKLPKYQKCIHPTSPHECVSVGTCLTVLDMYTVTPCGIPRLRYNIIRDGIQIGWDTISSDDVEKIIEEETLEADTQEVIPDEDIPSIAHDGGEDRDVVTPQEEIPAEDVDKIESSPQTMGKNNEADTPPPTPSRPIQDGDRVRVIKEPQHSCPHPTERGEPVSVGTCLEVKDTFYFPGSATRIYYGITRDGIVSWCEISENCVERIDPQQTPETIPVATLPSAPSPAPSRRRIQAGDRVRVIKEPNHPCPHPTERGEPVSVGTCLEVKSTHCHLGTETIYYGITRNKIAIYHWIGEDCVERIDASPEMPEESREAAPVAASSTPSDTPATSTPSDKPSRPIKAGDLVRLIRRDMTLRHPNKEGCGLLVGDTFLVSGIYPWSLCSFPATAHYEVHWGRKGEDWVLLDHVELVEPSPEENQETTPVTASSTPSDTPATPTPSNKLSRPIRAGDLVRIVHEIATLPHPDKPGCSLQLGDTFRVSGISIVCVYPFGIKAHYKVPWTEQGDFWTWTDNVELVEPSPEETPVNRDRETPAAPAPPLSDGPAGDAGTSETKPAKPVRKGDWVRIFRPTITARCPDVVGSSATVGSRFQVTRIEPPTIAFPGKKVHFRDATRGDDWVWLVDVEKIDTPPGCPSRPPSLAMKLNPGGIHFSPALFVAFAFLLSGLLLSIPLGIFSAFSSRHRWLPYVTIPRSSRMDNAIDNLLSSDLVRTALERLLAGGTYVSLGTITLLSILMVLSLYLKGIGKVADRGRAVRKDKRNEAAEEMSRRRENDERLRCQEIEREEKARERQMRERAEEVASIVRQVLGNMPIHLRVNPVTNDSLVKTKPIHPGMLVRFIEIPPLYTGKICIEGTCRPVGIGDIVRCLYLQDEKTFVYETGVNNYTAPLSAVVPA